MEFNIKLIEELDTDTSIEWWNKNRKKINEAIQMFNEWQINHRQDRYNAELVLAKVKSLKEWSDELRNRELSDWQIEILQDIENHVMEVIKSI